MRTLMGVPSSSRPLSRSAKARLAAREREREARYEERLRERATKDPRGRKPKPPAAARRRCLKRMRVFVVGVQREGGVCAFKHGLPVALADRGLGLIE